MTDTARIERRLKLNDLRVLLSVVDADSMHKAAERLATSQPAISRAITDLEHALGVRLLDRTQRRQAHAIWSCAHEARTSGLR